MIRSTLKSCIRWSIGVFSGDTVRVLRGPMKGRRLLRRHGLEQLSMLFGTYERAFVEAFSARVTNGCVVYDIGANCGYFSLLAAHQSRSNGRVLAFEPMPSVMQDLSALVDANDLNGRVACHQLALSDSTGRIKMFTPGSDKTAIIESALRGQRVSAESAIDVPTSTLDDIVFTDGNPRPQIIKIDVEGGEASVLAGAIRVLKEVRPTVLLEVHGDQPASEVWDLVTPLGYSIQLLIDGAELAVADRVTWMKYFSGSKWDIQHCILTPRMALAVAA